MEKNYGYYNLSFIDASIGEVARICGFGYCDKLQRYYGAAKFSKCLNRDSKVSSIKLCDNKRFCEDILFGVFVDKVSKYFAVSVKSSTFKSKVIPIIVQKCEEGYKDVICPEIIYRIKEFEKYDGFPNFDVKDNQPVRPGKVANIIRSMTDKDLEDYVVKAANLSEFIERYGQKLVEQNEALIKAKNEEEARKAKAQADREHEDIDADAFVKTYQKSKGKSLIDKSRN